ncbi:hypothetical protein PFAS1_28035 [Pseudomonas frederiksbergensis]|nr:hypothetical protein PFAS1_28035 [Pseudomonas frederiksbergensis]
MFFVGAGLLAKRECQSTLVLLAHRFRRNTARSKIMCSLKRVLNQRNLWRGSLLPLECVALTKIGNDCQIFGAATQPSASKLARSLATKVRTIQERA